MDAEKLIKLIKVAGRRGANLSLSTLLIQAIAVKVTENSEIKKSEVLDEIIIKGLGGPEEVIELLKGQI